MTYRSEHPDHIELREWDVLMLRGVVCLIGSSDHHIKNCVWRTFGARCHCLEEPRISSPVVCPETRRVLRESWWDHQETTGEARHLLGLTAGDVVEVESGRTYQLVGPRRETGYDSYAPASIFRVYARVDEERRRERARLWPRLRRLLGRIGAASREDPA